MRESGGWHVLEVKSSFSDTGEIEFLTADLAYTVMVFKRVTCSFAPPSGPLSPSGSLATVLTVTVNARPAATPNSPQVRGVTGQVAPWLLLAFASLALTIWPRARRPKESWSMRVATACAVLFLMLSIVSCGGGGGSSGSNPPPPPPPPPPTSVTVSVQAVSPSLSVNVGTVTLQVQ